MPEVETYLHSTGINCWLFFNHFYYYNL